MISNHRSGMTDGNRTQTTQGMCADTQKKMVADMQQQGGGRTTRTGILNPSLFMQQAPGGQQTLTQFARQFNTANPAATDQQNVDVMVEVISAALVLLLRELANRGLSDDAGQTAGGIARNTGQHADMLNPTATIAGADAAVTAPPGANIPSVRLDDGNGFAMGQQGGTMRLPDIPLGALAPQEPGQGNRTLPSLSSVFTQPAAQMPLPQFDQAVDLGQAQNLTIAGATAHETAAVGDAGTSAEGGDAPQTQAGKSGGGCPFLASQQQDVGTQGPQQGGNGGGMQQPDDPGEAGNTAETVNPADDRSIDFSTLNRAERREMGMEDRDRAILHLWGRQVLSTGRQDGGIYETVLGPDGTGANWGNKVEVELVKELRARERAQFGTDTGFLLDEAFFAYYKDTTGIDLSERYKDRPVHASAGAVDIVNDIDTLEQRTGLSAEDQGVLRLFGHDPLMDGEFDGSVLAYTIGNDNSLDSDRHSHGNDIDDVARRLQQQDRADDGAENGSSLNDATIALLDRIYARQ